jgi:hypothetical protein
MVGRTALWLRRPAISIAAAAMPTTNNRFMPPSERVHRQPLFKPGAYISRATRYPCNRFDLTCPTFFSGSYQNATNGAVAEQDYRTGIVDES